METKKLSRKLEDHFKSFIISKEHGQREWKEGKYFWKWLNVQLRDTDGNSILQHPRSIRKVPRRKEREGGRDVM